MDTASAGTSVEIDREGFAYWRAVGRLSQWLKPRGYRLHSSADEKVVYLWTERMEASEAGTEVAPSGDRAGSLASVSP